MTLPSDLAQRIEKEAEIHWEQEKHKVLSSKDGFKRGAQKLYEILGPELERLQMYKQGGICDFAGINSELRSQLQAKEAECERLRELLEQAKGWVITHAMQTYSKVAAKFAEEIDEALKGASS